MVKLKYKGVMSGFVKDVGNVKVNNVYDVKEAVAKKLLMTNNWVKTKSEPKLKKKYKVKKVKDDVKVLDDNVKVLNNDVNEENNTNDESKSRNINK